MVKRCVTMSSLRDGIVLWELQELKCQQRLFHETDVVRNSQVGWMVFILPWKMVKCKRRFALVKYMTVANTQMKFLLKTVDHTSSTSFSSFHPIVNYVIVVQTEWNNAMTEQLIHKSICVHMYFKRIKIVYSLSKSLKRCTND